MGDEDYRDATPRRAASAVRNFYAGVLLLLKEKLRQESPPGSNEALLYEKIVSSWPTEPAVENQRLASVARSSQSATAMVARRSSSL
jgi:hypothetical protein